MRKGIKRKDWGSILMKGGSKERRIVKSRLNMQTEKAKIKAARRLKKLLESHKFSDQVISYVSELRRPFEGAFQQKGLPECSSLMEKIKRKEGLGHAPYVIENKILRNKHFKELWKNEKNRGDLKKIVELFYTIAPIQFFGRRGDHKTFKKREIKFIQKYAEHDPHSKKPFIVHIIGAGLPRTKQPQRIAEELEKKGIKNYKMYVTDFEPSAVKKSKEIKEKLLGKIKDKVEFVPYDGFSGPLTQAHKYTMAPKIPKADMAIMTNVLCEVDQFYKGSEIVKNVFSGLKPGGKMFNISYVDHSGLPPGVKSMKPSDRKDYLVTIKPKNRKEYEEYMKKVRSNLNK